MSLMPQTPFQWFVPATTGTGLVPAAGYKAKFYAAGTTTPKNIYTNPALTIPYASPSNTAVLDTEGRALIYLGAGGYKLVITTPSDTPIYTQDNISGEGAFGTGFVGSFADLAAVNTTLNTYTYIGGYYTPGDGGEGMFYNKVSGSASDGGYIQASTFDLTKKWFRIPDEDGCVRAASFGYCGAGVRTSNLQAADAYALSINAKLRIQRDVTTCATITLSSSTIFNTSASLNVSGTSTLTVNGIVEAGGWDLFSSWNAVTLSYAQESRPEWLGASLTGSGAANATAFTKWKAANAGIYIVPPGTWAHTGTFTPVSDRITVFMGSVGTRVPGTFYGPSSLISGNLSLTLTGTYGLTGNLTLTGNQTISGTLTAPTLNGNVSVGGSLTVFTSVNAVDVTASNSVAALVSVGSGRDITAGLAGAGNTGAIRARAGTSSSLFKAAGNLFNVVGTGTGTIGAAVVADNNDSIKITAWGTRTGGSSADTFKVQVGGADVFDFGATVDFQWWKVEVEVVRNSSTTGVASGALTYGNSGPTSLATTRLSLTSPSITWANSNTVAVVTTTGSYVQRLIRGDLYPAI